MAFVSLFVLCLLVRSAGAHRPSDRYSAALTLDFPPIPSTPIMYHDMEYTLDETTYEGYVAYPSKWGKDPLPGVLVGHAFMGIRDAEKFRTREWATYGYVAFGLDVYGKHIRPTDPTDGRNNMSELTGNPVELHRRVFRALDVLKSLGEGPVVNRSALVMSGYCFGGVMGLELVRQGAPLIAVSAFHPALKPLIPTTSNITASIQVHHAEYDGEGDQGLLDFEAEMKSNGTPRWETLKYGHCYHGWTDVSSSVYAPAEAWQAHASTREFFAHVLGNPSLACVNPPNEEPESATGKIVGAAIGGVLGGVIVTTGAAYLLMRRKSYTEV